MNKFTRHSKRIRITYIVSAMIIILVMAIAFPWFRMPEEDDKLYEVSVNGTVVGVCDDRELINELYLDARAQFEKDSEEEVYIDSDLEFTQIKKVFGKSDDIAKIKANIHKAIEESVVDTNTPAYVVDIDGLSITLSSADEIVELLEAAKSKYDVNNEFDTVLYNDEASRFAKLS